MTQAGPDMTTEAAAGFTMYPAIDVREGRVVRLRQGDYARETRYDDSPLALAQRYAQAGAGWLHLVDLDAARSGGYTLAPLLDDIRRHTPLRVQTGGGVRAQADVDALLEAGASRVVIGSLAVRDPRRVLGWLTRYGADRITVALDARLSPDGQWRLPTSGWTQQSGAVLEDLLELFADGGLRHLLCTDIDRDGMLSGPNLDLYRRIRACAPGIALQASGGIRDLDDIAAVRRAGCAGVVLGKALLDGRFVLDDALAQAAPC
jgi:phosphoribosylformimino-5-aminoimidazole carboxamide ribotide isomerase